MPFTKEAEFEDALVDLLIRHGWDEHVLHDVNEQDLIDNWAQILFDNNKEADRLNNQPLTKTEMDQVMEQVRVLPTPVKRNEFINGKFIAITRDNPNDSDHLGREVSLKIYDRIEIAAGKSRYQIVRQPRFRGSRKLAFDRRGDVLLLVNGMPAIHLELKRSGIPVSQACNQIDKYLAEGMFSGIFSLVQIFVAMAPEETVYFAHPGDNRVVNKAYRFHWEDVNNEPMNDWKDIVMSLLSIPMAHKMLGFYTVADSADGVLKVMRSYQVYAAEEIADQVRNVDWGCRAKSGGFVWHTTGSGKTLTSFKAAQLVTADGSVQKVVFLVDRVELGTQSVNEYKGFADTDQDVQRTENTSDLVHKLKSTEPKDKLIVTSIQKMSRLATEERQLRHQADLEQIRKKRMVCIVDECHRSVFGEMMVAVRQAFPNVLFFGFSGTPIHEENKKHGNDTSTIFGRELHRYSLADGIRDKNVLGFDLYKVLTFRDADIRRVVALDKCRAASEADALADKRKAAVYYRYMNELPMAGDMEKDGSFEKGVEDELPTAQYEMDAHRKAVVTDIRDNWQMLSRQGKFHAMFATSSIPEAVAYYGLFKEMAPEMKVTALFDPNIDNTGDMVWKEDALVGIVKDYNERYGKKFDVPGFYLMKKDISSRLSHKSPYEHIDNVPKKQIDLLIVVDQMLTGFDSKWVNTLYLDKMLEYENLIQAFSRTNRVFGKDKPFGTIRYYRRPHTMEKRIQAAVKLYSGDKPFYLFADKLADNIARINEKAAAIKNLFKSEGQEDMAGIPKSVAARKKFTALFRELDEAACAAVVQGFDWERLDYEIRDEQGNVTEIVHCDIDRTGYRTMAKRYKESFDAAALEKAEDEGAEHVDPDDIPYEIDPYLTVIETDDIDQNYMNDRFRKFLKMLKVKGKDDAEVEEALEEIHSTFAVLSMEEQKYAEIFLHEVRSGSIVPDPDKSLSDYIMERVLQGRNDRIAHVAGLTGADERMLRKVKEESRKTAKMQQLFQKMIHDLDLEKAKAYLADIGFAGLPAGPMRAKMNSLLGKFVDQDVFTEPETAVR